MSGTTYMAPAEREDVRLRFFREYSRLPALASVAIRRNENSDVWFLDVGANGSIDLPATFAGLDVRVQQTSRAVNAVALFESGA